MRAAFRFQNNRKTPFVKQIRAKLAILAQYPDESGVRAVQVMLLQSPLVLLPAKPFLPAIIGMARRRMRMRRTAAGMVRNGGAGGKCGRFVEIRRPAALFRAFSRGEIAGWILRSRDWICILFRLKLQMVVGGPTGRYEGAGLARLCVLFAGMVCLHACLLHGGEAALPHGEWPEGTLSVRKNAVVKIGGELNVDAVYRSAGGGTGTTRPDTKQTDFSLKNATLRLVAEAHPNFRAMFRIDLQPSREIGGGRDGIVAEAMLVMHSLAGGGLGFFAGKGRAPYGQDITLGIVQSYHHSANRNLTAEGRVHIIDPPGDVVPDPSGGSGYATLPPMRPGQFERTFQAGVAYDRDSRWRVEIAAFQPERGEYRARLDRRGNGSDIGFAGRMWWRTPIDGLVAEASAMATHSSDMGRKDHRLDLPAAAVARNNAYAVSLGFDWKMRQWRLFGEFQRAWDWNFSKDYDVSIWQIGASRDFGEAWRLGGMAEEMRIRDPAANGLRDKYFKFTLNVRYVFHSGAFLLFEYGHEWFRRHESGRLTDTRRGDFFGMRLGLAF